MSTASGESYRKRKQASASARPWVPKPVRRPSWAAARSVANRVVAAWYDLNHLAVGPEALHFVSLFDDTVDVWEEGDFRLVEELSTVARWSRPDEFASVLLEPSE